MLKFSQERHAQNDIDARRTTVNFYKSQFNLNVTGNPNIFDIDLVCEDGSYIEVEKRGPKVWSSINQFKYDSFSIPYRKFKFLDKPGSYVVVANDLSELAITPFQSILEAPIIIKDNVMTSSREPFFNVNVSAFTFYACNQETQS